MVLFVVVLLAGALVGSVQSPTFSKHVAAILVEILTIAIEINPIKTLDAPLRKIASASYAANAPEEAQVLPVFTGCSVETTRHILYLLTVSSIFVIGVILCAYGLLAYGKATSQVPTVYWPNRQQTYLNTVLSECNPLQEAWQAALGQCSPASAVSPASAATSRLRLTSCPAMDDDAQDTETQGTRQNLLPLIEWRDHSIDRITIVNVEQDSDSGKDSIQSDSDPPLQSSARHRQLHASDTPKAQPSSEVHAAPETVQHALGNPPRTKSPLMPETDAALDPIERASESSTETETEPLPSTEPNAAQESVDHAAEIRPSRKSPRKSETEPTLNPINRLSENPSKINTPSSSEPIVAPKPVEHAREDPTRTKSPLKSEPDAALDAIERASEDSLKKKIPPSSKSDAISRALKHAPQDPLKRHADSTSASRDYAELPQRSQAVDSKARREKCLEEYNRIKEACDRSQKRQNECEAQQKTIELAIQRTQNEIRALIASMDQKSRGDKDAEASLPNKQQTAPWNEHGSGSRAELRKVRQQEDLEGRRYRKGEEATTDERDKNDCPKSCGLDACSDSSSKDGDVPPSPVTYRHMAGRRERRSCGNFDAESTGSSCHVTARRLSRLGVDELSSSRPRPWILIPRPKQSPPEPTAGRRGWH